MVLGLLLARGRVPVVVMEKHADFLRDFRGDTVHASTLRLLDELGLGPRFAQMPHRVIDSIRMEVQDVPVELSLRTLPGAHKHIALVPQWDFLELLATAAEAEPTFTLMRSTEVLGPLKRNGRVVGVRYRSDDGETREIHAQLTVACDGRSSTLRSSMGLVPRGFGAPMDVWWFRLPRQSDDSIYELEIYRIAVGGIGDREQSEQTAEFFRHLCGKPTITIPDGESDSVSIRA